jgi:glycosyltransferase involved in cell wall biosynthesis
MTQQPFNPLETPQRPELTIDLKRDGTGEQVSIVIVHRDRPAYLNMCLQSITLMSNLNNYEIIVVDNGSGKTTQDYLDVVQDEGIKVIRNQDNLLWSRAANIGAAAADPNSQYFIFMHCDTVVLNSSWLDILVNVSQTRDAGIVGLQMQSYYIQKQRADFIPEWCMLMTRQCWDDCGNWPEELPLVGMAYIMTVRAQYKGHKPQAMNNALVHHYGAFVMDPSEYEQHTEKAYSVVPKLMRLAQI